MSDSNPTEQPEQETPLFASLLYTRNTKVSRNRNTEDYRFLLCFPRAIYVQHSWKSPGPWDALWPAVGTGAVVWVSAHRKVAKTLDAKEEGAGAGALSPSSPAPCSFTSCWMAPSSLKKKRSIIWVTRRCHSYLS